uniref:Cytosolic Fe-S cluster assembly factor NUBP1 homolog n=1 Tax=Peronospora matthiolae TaxID=2874970 RepID=A0AAV1TDS5_9STRA
MAPTVPENANASCVGPQAAQAGKADGCAGCPNQTACASGAARVPDPAISDVKQRLANVKHKILVLSGKGGVGKSTVACQLAFALASKGFQVGLLDVDITGPSVPRMLGLVGHEVHQSAAGWSPVYVEDNLGVMSIGFMLPNADDAIIWRGPKKSGIIKQFLVDVQWGELDYLIIDTPPGTSDEHISIVQYMKEADLDGAVVVTTPQEVALSDVRKELNFCHKTKIKVLGVVENMSGIQRRLDDVQFVGKDGNDETEAVKSYCKRRHQNCCSIRCRWTCFLHQTEVARQWPRCSMCLFFGRLPLDNKLTEACEEGVSFLEDYPHSVAAPVFGQIVQGIIASVEK